MQACDTKVMSLKKRSSVKMYLSLDRRALFVRHMDFVVDKTEPEKQRLCPRGVLTVPYSSHYLEKTRESRRCCSDEYGPV